MIDETTADLFRAPLHEFIAEALAAEIKAEVRLKILGALGEFEQRAKQIIAFHHRSIAQRRRFLRIRQLTGPRP